MVCWCWWWRLGTWAGNLETLQISWVRDAALGSLHKRCQLRNGHDLGQHTPHNMHRLQGCSGAQLHTHPARPTPRASSLMRSLTPLISSICMAEQCKRQCMAASLQGSGEVCLLCTLGAANADRCSIVTCNNSYVQSVIGMHSWSSPRPCVCECLPPCDKHIYTYCAWYSTQSI